MVGESQEAVGAGVGGQQSGSNKTPTLEEYGTDLTAQVGDRQSLRSGIGGGRSLTGVLSLSPRPRRASWTPWSAARRRSSV